MRPLVERLESLGIGVWCEAGALAPGEDFAAWIAAGRAQSDLAVVLITPHWLDAAWPWGALEEALAEEPGQADVLVLLAGVPEEVLAACSPVLAQGPCIAIDPSHLAVAARRVAVKVGLELARGDALFSVTDELLRYCGMQALDSATLAAHRAEVRAQLVRRIAHISLRLLGREGTVALHRAARQTRAAGRRDRLLLRALAARDETFPDQIQEGISAHLSGFANGMTMGISRTNAENAAFADRLVRERCDDVAPLMASHDVASEVLREADSRVAMWRAELRPGMRRFIEELPRFRTVSWAAAGGLMVSCMVLLAAKSMTEVFLPFSNGAVERSALWIVLLATGFDLATRLLGHRLAGWLTRVNERDL